MKVFDFDNTLYRGESCIDFTLYMIRCNKRIILMLPMIFFNLIRYKLCIISKNEIETLINDSMQKIIKDKNEVLSITKDFWDKNIRKLNTGLIESITEDDAVISAGPRFLLEAVIHNIGTSNLICSEVDLDKKQIIYLNFGENKVKEYRKKYGTTPIDSFYTDSYNDKAMMDISDEVYLVRKWKIKRIK